jgi:plasmid stabilization system protein ParE
MDFELVWTEPAVEELQAVIAYIASQGSRTSAEKLRAEILGHVEILRTFPYIGPVYPRDKRGLVREILCRKYRIFYRADEVARRVEILTVWHGSRKEPHLPD